MEVNIYEAVRSLQAEVNSLKQRNEEIISSLNKEIEDLKEIVTQMKNELQDKESCMLSYFGPNQGNYPYSIWRAEANKETKLPFFYISENSIVDLEYHQEGTKITFKKSGNYLLMFNILCNNVFQKPTKIRVYTTQGPSYPHYLNSSKILQPNVSSQVISGHKFCQYKEGDFIYVCVRPEESLDITGNSSVNTLFEIIKIK